MTWNSRGLGNGWKKVIRVGECGRGSTQWKSSPLQQQTAGSLFERVLVEVADWGCDCTSLWKED